MANDNADIRNFVEKIKFETLVVPAAREILHAELKDLFEHWTELRGRRFAPAWSAFDWDGVPPRLVPHCATVEVRRNPLDFVYVYWGVGRKVMQRGDYTGKSMRDFRPKAIAEKAIRESCEVLTQQAAICVMTESLESGHSQPFDYQFLRLPFSEDGETVSHIMGVGLYDEKVMQRAYDFYNAQPDDDVDLGALIRRPDPAAC